MVIDKLPITLKLYGKCNSYILNKNNDTGISLKGTKFKQQHNDGEITLLAN